MGQTLHFLVPLLLGLASAQTPGKTLEIHPKLQTWKCTRKGGCLEQNLGVVLDDLSHPVHQLVNTNLDCGEFGAPPNVTVCPDAATCAKNCIVEGISNYTQHGVTTQEDRLHMTQLNAAGNVLSPRVYLLAESGREYELLQLTGNELTFDVDVSKLPCGMNGALYLSEMDKTGGMSALNTAGAKYGTGYCDAQCFVNPFVNGVGNIEGKGACCNEMDIWEANAISTQLAPHTCNHTGLYQCSGDECGANGVCDKSGCAINPYGVGDKAFYGREQTVDTNRPFTVVTQFPAENGKLEEIRRLYIQDGRVIQNAVVNVTGLPAINFIDDDYCTASGATRFMDLGALEGMGGALSRGMVLIFSIWWDTGAFMNWLDSGNAGPCNATEGDPTVIQQVQPDTAVTWSQIKWGEINSTFSARHH